MVYLFKIVDLSMANCECHNQMVLSSKAHPNSPSYDVRCGCPRIPSSYLFEAELSELRQMFFCCGHASAPLRPHFVAKIPRIIGSLEICPQLTQNQQGVFCLWMRAPSYSRKCGEVWLSASSPVYHPSGLWHWLPQSGAFDTKDPKSCFVNGMP